MRQLLISLLATLIPFGVSSQNFNYTATADSVAWNEISAQTMLNTSNSAWNFSYRIPIGFTFNYLGHDFDSLTIETNGYLVFDANRYYAFTAFNQFGDHVDGSGNHTVLSYELSGTSGNHVLKIQYKNASQSLSDLRVQSWQIWLKENGNVELRVGPGDYRTHAAEIPVQDSTVTTDSLGIHVSYSEHLDTMYVVDSLQYCRIGLLNPNMDTETRGYFLSGSTTAPSGVPVNDANPDTASMQTIPAQGYRYTFTPSFN